MKTPERIRRHCESCQAPIFWVWTEQGKKIPLDFAPVATGNVTIDPAGRAKVYSPLFPPPPGEPTFVSHFATCPDASKWRRKDR